MKPLDYAFPELPNFKEKHKPGCTGNCKNCPNKGPVKKVKNVKNDPKNI